MIVLLLLLLLVLSLSESSLKSSIRAVAKVCYDGSSFYGYQRGGSSIPRTVQGVLEEKLSSFYQYPIRTVAASRTDRGVHALGQVVHFDIPLTAPTPNAISLTEAINCPDLIIKECNIAPIGLLPIQISDGLPFHALMNAKYKHYQYKFIINDEKMNPLDRNYIADIHNHIRTKRRSAFDIVMFKECLKLFVGSHDFQSFGNDLRKRSSMVASYKNETFDSTRTIYNITVNENDSSQYGIIYSVDFYLNGALYKMVRNIVEAAVEVAYGEVSIGYVSYLLKQHPHPRSRDQSKILTAPACGLYLINVYYDEVVFGYDQCY